MTNQNKKLIHKLGCKLDCILPTENGVNVLVIDDDIPNLKTFKAVFRRDANIFTASNKEEALDVVNSKSIDVIFCDYMMPINKGSDILKCVLDKFPNIKSTILTAHNNPSIMEEFMDKTGISDVIEKGSNNIEEIKSRIFHKKDLVS